MNRIIKHYIQLFLCLCVSNLISAQFEVSASTLSGYESNILRVPDRLLIDDEIINDDELYQSSFYQDVIAYLKYTRESRKSEFNISAKPQRRFYFSESDSDRLLLDLKTSFKLDIGKTSSWQSEAQYYLKDQNGLDADENEVGASFAYNVLNFDSQLNFRLYRSNRSFVGVHYGKKTFDPTETREVSYHKYGVNLGFKNVKWKNHLLRSYGITSSFIQRKYDIGTRSEDDEFVTENRTWNYLNTRAFFKIELSKFWTLYPSLTYEKRLDQSNERFGYNEWTPKVYLAYEKDKFKMSISGSYTNRRFTDLTVNESELLTYDYIRCKVNLSYRLFNNISIISQAYYINRDSNNSDLSATTFRSYSNYYAGVGLKINF